MMAVTPMTPTAPTAATSARPPTTMPAVFFAPTRAIVADGSYEATGGASHLLVRVRVAVPETAALERRDARDLVVRQREAEHVGVLPLAIGVRRLRDRRGSVLHVPAHHDLRSRRT